MQPSNEEPSDTAIAFDACALDDRGRHEQRERYRSLARTVVGRHRSDEALFIEFGDRVDRALLERALDVERACCPFFRFDLNRSGRHLRVTVESREQLPALDAIASALAPV